MRAGTLDAFETRHERVGRLAHADNAVCRSQQIPIALAHHVPQLLSLGRCLGLGLFLYELNIADVVLHKEGINAAAVFIVGLQP